MLIETIILLGNTYKGSGDCNRLVIKSKCELNTTHLTEDKLYKATSILYIWLYFILYEHANHHVRRLCDFQPKLLCITRQRYL